MSNNKSYIGSLDGIRALAALMVMFFHFFQNRSFSEPILSLIKKIAMFGQTGVSLFFVLSGFLITRILLRDKNKERFFLNFYMRRTLRIFPLYYLYLILVFFVIPLLSHTDIPKLNEQIYHWIYLQDFAITFNWNYSGPLHFWSLAVEEHFYLFFPLLVFYLNKRQLLVALMVILLSSIICRWYLNYKGYEVFYFTFARMDELAMGALLAILELSNFLTKKNSIKFIYLFIFSVVPTVLLWVLFSKEQNDILQVFKFSLISVCYFSLVGFIVSIGDNGFFNKLLTSKPLIFTGKISYGLYVYHGLCFYFFHKLIPTSNVIWSFVGSFILAYIVASLSFYLFESRFFKLKKHFTL